MKIGLFYGTTTGNTEEVAELIQEHLGGENISTLGDVNALSVDSLVGFDLLILGIPTWHIGEMQDDWADRFDELDSVDLTGTKVALFGLGDQDGYPDTFLDGMGELYDKLLQRGAEGGIGFTSTEEFDYTGSTAIRDGKFCGLAIDQDCQAEMTEERVTAWCSDLVRAVGIPKED